MGSENKALIFNFSKKKKKRLQSYILPWKSVFVCILESSYSVCFYCLSWWNICDIDISNNGQFNNYITPKLLFVYSATPYHHALSGFFMRTLLRCVTLTNTLSPFHINFFFSNKHWLVLGEAVTFSCQRHLKTLFFESMC